MHQPSTPDRVELAAAWAPLCWLLLALPDADSPGVATLAVALGAAALLAATAVRRSPADRVQLLLVLGVVALGHPVLAPGTRSIWSDGALAAVLAALAVAYLALLGWVTARGIVRDGRGQEERSEADRWRPRIEPAAYQEREPTDGVPWGVLLPRLTAVPFALAILATLAYLYAVWQLPGVGGDVWDVLLGSLLPSVAGSGAIHVPLVIAMGLAAGRRERLAAAQLREVGWAFAHALTYPLFVFRALAPTLLSTQLVFLVLVLTAVGLVRANVRTVLVAWTDPDESESNPEATAFT